MTPRSGHPSRGAALRAIALTGLAVTAAAVIWRLRPTSAPGTTAPDAAVVWGCAWLAWALAAYLAVATAAASLATLLDGLGRGARFLRRLAPRHLRRLVDVAVTASVAASIVSTAAAPAGAAARPVVVSERAPLVAGSPLDWPGLTTAAPQRDHHRHGPAAKPSQDRLRSRRPPPPPSVGLVNGSPGGHAREGAEVVVQPGDTLWRIAANALGPGASGAAITAAWHAWYHANRAVIGADPNVIRPGQHLRSPGSAQPATRPATRRTDS